MISNIKGKGTHHIFDLDEEVDVRNVAGSQGIVETSLEEVNDERINGGEREVDDKFGIPITKGVEDRSRHRKSVVIQGVGQGGEKIIGQDCKERVEFTAGGMVRKGLCGGRWATGMCPPAP
ncbi:hypothetical protein SUGI_0845320 [Cryptomeria japonica]|nr:hypothetical protein SUGI_0845320 [Cryptomeria japonica]